MAAMDAEIQALAESLTVMRLLPLGAGFVSSRLSGGVSCDVWRIEVAGRAPFVVKRALPRLRVAADWRAPPERATAEVAWINLVAGIVPGAVPKVLGEDRAGHLFAMEYLPPDTHPLWKAELAEGTIDLGFAARVGATLARIHAATAGRDDIARAFANGAQFHALRLEPYLLFTAQKHPALAPAFEAEAARIAAARIALMQGDISPKNILHGPDGPVFLDAETACYGDPAFDVAFCMNHFLLKAVWQPQWTADYAAAFDAMRAAYLSGVTWEKPHELDRRIARLLPMLFLARVDGKSPVEYLTDEGDISYVRAAAIQMIVEPPANLAVLAEAYFPLAAMR
jgi:aminoglycoside phosphotransferase (APT) family kinase protein